MDHAVAERGNGRAIRKIQYFGLGLVIEHAVEFHVCAERIEIAANSVFHFDIAPHFHPKRRTRFVRQLIDEKSGMALDGRSLFPLTAKAYNNGESKKSKLGSFLT
ncbi:MAG: hypothetical protein C4527_19460 [Candidatus Omnitrophota bacterium]|jgi:hypothetical protein|nr:MAG: hypothetical protein C4527_19460 [Candidatus Omnitrophota bacterium]